MAAVTICIDFGAPKIKSLTDFLGIFVLGDVLTICLTANLAWKFITVVLTFSIPSVPTPAKFMMILHAWKPIVRIRNNLAPQFTYIFLHPKRAVRELYVNKKFHWANQTSIIYKIFSVLLLTSNITKVWHSNLNFCFSAFGMLLSTYILPQKVNMERSAYAMK